MSPPTPGMACACKRIVRGTECNAPETLIVGRRGRLARAFAHCWPKAMTVGSDDLDIRVREAVAEGVLRRKPRLVINCAAMTDMARCEREPVAAWVVNVEGVRNLAEAATHVGAVLVHFSSDYARDPKNEYARTKRASEEYADLTVRAKIYDGSHWAWLALKNGRSVRMTTTEHCNPVTTTGVVAATACCLRRGVRGVVSFGTSERLSLFQVGLVWASALQASPELVEAIGPVESPVPRLSEMFLPTGPIHAAGVPVPSLLRDAVRHMGCYGRYGLRDCDVTS